MKRQTLFAILILLSGSSYAELQHFIGKVTDLEPTDLPGIVHFRMDVGNAKCPAGEWLKWQKTDHSNNRAAYATLMTAMVAGKRVKFFVETNDVGCVGRYLHLYG